MALLSKFLAELNKALLSTVLAGLGQARLGLVRLGQAWPGWARQGKAGIFIIHCSSRVSSSPARLFFS
jgi:hypothetical protein